MRTNTLKRTVTWLGPTKVGGILAVLASVVLSTAANGMLGEYVRIHWSVGVHYGPEYTSTLVVLGGFPVVVAAPYVGCMWLGRHLKRTDELEDVRWYYEVAVFGPLGELSHRCSQYSLLDSASVPCSLTGVPYR